MAYIDQARKKKIAPVIKDICTRYRVKGRLSINDHSTLVLNVSSGKIDFIGNREQMGALPGDNYINVNPYWYKKDFSGIAEKFITEVMAAMNDGNIQADCFDVGWYVKVNIGRWDKPYILE